MAREQVTTVPRHLQVYTHVTGVPRPSAISVPRHRHPRETITAGKGWGICRFAHTS